MYVTYHDKKLGQKSLCVEHSRSQRYLHGEWGEGVGGMVERKAPNNVWCAWSTGDGLSAITEPNEHEDSYHRDL